MNLRQAYELVIANELRELDFDEDQIEILVQQLSNDRQFHEDLTEAIQEHLDTFGSNYGL